MIDEKRLQEIEMRAEREVEPGLASAADLRELIAEVRRLRAASEQPGMDVRKAHAYAKEMGLPTSFPL